MRIQIDGVKGPGTIFINPDHIVAVENSGSKHPGNPVLTLPGCRIRTVDGHEYYCDQSAEDINNLLKNQ